TRARPEGLARILQCAASALPDDGEVIVVDGDPNRSAEPVAGDTRSRHPRWHLISLPSRPGITAQRNVGIDAASGDVLVFLDDDCTFEAGFFEALQAPYEDSAVVGVTGRIDG